MFSLIATLFSKLKQSKQQQSQPQELVTELKPEVQFQLVTKRVRDDEPEITMEEILFRKEFLVRIKNALSRYDFVKKDKIEFLAKRILDNTYNDGEILPLQDKKKFKLNTRAKYTKELIECFDSVETLKFDPKCFCKNLQSTERSITWSIREIESLKDVDFVDKVHLDGVGDWDGKVVGFDQIPPFPIIDYTKDKCLFFVSAEMDL